MNQTQQAVSAPAVGDLEVRRPARTRARRAVVILIALAAALLDWLLSAKIIGIDLIVNQGAGDQAIQPALVAAAPVISGFLGCVLLAIFERVAPRRARTIWRAVAIVVLVLSLSGPLAAAQSVATAIALVSMHLVVGVILIIGLPGVVSGRPARRS